MVALHSRDPRCFSKIESLDKIKEILLNKEVPEKDFKLNKTEKDISRTIDSLQSVFYKGL